MPRPGESPGSYAARSEGFIGLDELARRETEGRLLACIEAVGCELLEKLAKRPDVDLQEAATLAHGFVDAMATEQRLQPQQLAEAIAVVIDLIHRRREAGG